MSLCLYYKNMGCCIVLIPILIEHQVFFYFSLIKEGATEKVWQLIMPLKSIFNKKFDFIENDFTFEYNMKVETREMYLK
jgi:hypothetical protein